MNTEQIQQQIEEGITLLKMRWELLDDRFKVIEKRLVEIETTVNCHAVINTKRMDEIEKKFYPNEQEKP